MVQNNDTMLKVSRLLATGLEILVANAKFSVALVTSWSQFRTLLLKQQGEKVVVFTEKGLSEEAALMERESFTH